jgi:hypothetical protein
MFILKRTRMVNIRSLTCVTLKHKIKANVLRYKTMNLSSNFKIKLRIKNIVTYI